MKLPDIEIGRRYICEYLDGRYFAVVINKNDAQVLVTLGDRVNEDGDPCGDPTKALYTMGAVWVRPEIISEM
jgi:hypothetical protein